MEEKSTGPAVQEPNDVTLGRLVVDKAFSPITIDGPPNLLLVEAMLVDQMIPKHVHCLTHPFRDSALFFRLIDGVPKLLLLILENVILVVFDEIPHFLRGVEINRAKLRELAKTSSVLEPSRTSRDLLELCFNNMLLGVSWEGAENETSAFVSWNERGLGSFQVSNL